MKMLGLSTRVMRAGLTALIVLDLLAVAAFAVRRTTVTVRTTRPAASSSPTDVSAAPPSSAPSTVAPSAPAVAIAAGGGSGSSAVPTSDGHGTSTAPAPPPKSGIPPVRIAAIGKCPVKISTPDQIGGVQSLVAFAPAFGPFSAEAFAAASAYQPELELLGPILAQYPKAAPVLDPLLAPVLGLFAQGSTTLFGVLAPFYAPHRTEVLSAETQLAAALAPYSAKLAGTPMAGCVVELEAALVGDTKSDKSK